MKIWRTIGQGDVKAAVSGSRFAGLQDCVSSKKW